MTDYVKIRRQAEMARQLTILCEAIDDDLLEGLCYQEFPETLEFDLDSKSKDLRCNIIFALSCGHDDSDLYTEVSIWQPETDNFLGARQRLTMTIGDNFEIEIIDEDCEHTINPDLAYRIEAELFNAFPDLTRPAPLTEDDRVTMNALDDLDRLSDAQEKLRHKLKVREWANH